MEFYNGNHVAEIRDVIVKCESCEGEGTIWNKKKQDFVKCRECNGEGKFVDYR